MAPLIAEMSLSVCNYVICFMFKCNVWNLFVLRQNSTSLAVWSLINYIIIIIIISIKRWRLEGNRSST